ncbi:PREDICTED: class I histocompatibility antigen, F10 alpha chain-like [Gekko japonicus]|uniref:Class I histocompatibility antigen, F10 alpha chain-like n=1 Tax=Gekko japonicus TaxID=146911 RepID=A0ABM1JM82_GEKJA|nr:PREDICTED: class I histocompatibility antigen, F10 alpha chain-like [Gekko japonicus]
MVRTTKETLSKLDSKDWNYKLAVFLFGQRTTPHTETGRSPAELLMGHRLTSQLDRLHPDRAPEVEPTTESYEATRGFFPEDPVYAKNYGQGPPWVPARVVRDLEPQGFEEALAHAPEPPNPASGPAPPPGTSGIAAAGNATADRPATATKGSPEQYPGTLPFRKAQEGPRIPPGLWVHTWQVMYGCEVGPEGRFRGGHQQYAYNGEDFIALDRETVTWTARVPQAEETKRRWEGEMQYAQHTKDYQEGTCVEWLWRYLGYGNETLLRTEAPVVRLARKKGYDGQETLFCQLHGIYPKGIEVTWTKDGEDRMAETMTGGVVPNSDGTYNTWLSIEVDPKEKDRYQCRVGHDSLLEPLDLAWEEPASNFWLIVGVVIVGVVLAALLLGAGVAFYMRQRRRPEGDYNAAPVE